MKSTPRMLIVTAIAALLLVASGRASAITFDGTASFQPNSAFNGAMFDASGSDKLVVVATGEHNFPNNAGGDINSITYDGVLLTQAVNRQPIGPNPSNDATAADIWYLDNPGAAHVSGTLGASVNGNGNNYVFTVLGLSGTAPGVSATAVSAPNLKSVDLLATVNNSFVVASHGMGGNGNTANVNVVDAVAPATEIAALEAGNNWAGHVVSITNNVAAGNATYAFTGGSTDGTVTIAAAFAPFDPGAPPPATLTLGDRVLVSENNANFDISVFPGQASYNDRGQGGVEPGAPSFLNILGDGTVLDYNFVGNAGTGSALTTYAMGAEGRIPTPTAPAANVHGSGENWANVWTTSDPMTSGNEFTTTKDHNPTGVAGAANTFARAAEVDGTIDISGLESGVIYFPHGTFVNQWTLSVVMTGPGQPDLMAFDSQDTNGINRNFGWITDFVFENPGGLYTEISYNYTHQDRDGSRSRFMGVILDGTPLAAVPEPATATLALLGIAGLAMRRRRSAA